MKKKRENCSDEQLMLRFREGDMGAFQELYKRYEKRLYHFFRYCLGNDETADDLFQECFLRLIGARHRYAAQNGSFSSWVFTIAHNLVRDTMRYRSRRGQVEVPTANFREINAVSGENDSPFQRLRLKERAAILQRAMDRLPTEQREVILLSRFSGLSFAEISEVLGCSPQAAKQRAYRAMQNLRKILWELTGRTDDAL